MNLKHRSLKMFGAMFVLALAAVFIAACGATKTTANVTDGKMTICHANGKTETPYDQLTLDFAQLPEHSRHKNDIIPAAADGCPQTLQENVNDGKISICHATSSAGNSYKEIAVAFNALAGHGKHKSDIIPAPESGCPFGTETPTTTLTPAITGTPATAEPSSTAAPSATTAGDTDKKITICHATGNGKKTSYVMITISINGLNGHSKHARDIIPAPAGGCPK